MAVACGLPKQRRSGLRIPSALCFALHSQASLTEDDPDRSKVFSALFDILYAMARNSQRMTSSWSLKSGVHLGALDTTSRAEHMIGLLRFLHILLTSPSVPVR